MDHAKHKPLLVSNTTAKQLINVGNTKYWGLVKAGKIKTVDVGGRSMAVYASLEALVDSEASPKAA